MVLYRIKIYNIYLYCFYITEGIEEIVVPCGKLSVSEDELQNYNKLTLLSTEIREPRLVA